MQASSHTHDDPSAWPPGTVTLEDFRQAEGGSEESFEIVLVPTPTEDPNDPLNWKKWEKNLNFGLTLLYSLIVFALISVITPTWTPMMMELGFTLTELNNSYATGSGMLAIGALCFIPFALKYGRRPIYLFSLLGQFAVAIWAANIQNTVDLFMIQVFNCLLGALAEVIVQMTIADVFFVHQRGMMNTLYVLTMSVGTAFAGIVSGYITIGQGWRWVWWWVAILVGISLILFAFFYEETKFAPKIDGVSGITHIIRAKGDQDDKELDHKVKEEQLEPVSSVITARIPPRKSYAQRLKPISTTQGRFTELLVHSYQPLLVMCTIPAVTYVAILYGLVTAALQVSVTLVASRMPAPPYNFNAAQVGLMSLPIFIGNMIGAVVSAPFIDRIILYLARKNKGIYEPEMRLWLLLLFAPIFPAGLLVFGYALDKGMSWPVVAVGIGLFGFAMVPISSVALAYLTDAYTEIIADAVAGITFIRNVLATVFVVSLTPWVARVQLHNVMLTFAMITLFILVGGTIGFIMYGKRMRSATVGMYRHYARRQMDTRS